MKLFSRQYKILVTTCQSFSYTTTTTSALFNGISLNNNNKSEGAQRFVRFLDENDNIKIGEPLKDINDDGDDKVADNNGCNNTTYWKRAAVLKGTSLLDAKSNLNISYTGEIANIKKLLSPLNNKDVPSILCCGLNYKAHAAETGMKEPKSPIIFMKNNNAILNIFNDNIEIPLIANRPNRPEIDYEAELCIVIGHSFDDTPCKNVSKNDALSKHILGFTVAM